MHDSKLTVIYDGSATGVPLKQVIKKTTDNFSAIWRPPFAAKEGSYRAFWQTFGEEGGGVICFFNDLKLFT